jgi:hypothetical protein
VFVGAASIVARTPFARAPVVTGEWVVAVPPLACATVGAARFRSLLIAFHHLASPSTTGSRYPPARE